MAVTFNVTTAAYLPPDLLLDFQQAASEWSHYLAGDITLNVQLDVGPFPGNLGFVVQNDSNTFVATGGTLDGHQLVETWAQYALATGTHVPGWPYDIHIYLDPNASIYVNPNPAAGGPVPGPLYDAVTIFRKALAYGLGFAAFTSTNASDGTIVTLLDHYMQPGTGYPVASPHSQDFAGGMVLASPQAVAVNGGPVALTIPTLGWHEAGVHLGNTPTISGATDLMAETLFLAGRSVPISRLDLAIMQDAGLPIVNIPCFAAGTRLRTTRGPVPVETLTTSDRLVLAAGGSAPVTWIGHRHLDCRRHPRPQDVRPIRIRPGAFAPGVPERDLRLSPDHAVSADGVLIPVRYLVNGTTIAQEPAGAITYFHVELPRHAIVLAEGLPAESYLDTGNRAAFANGGPAIDLHPEFARFVWAQHGCAPLVLAGPHLAAVRRRLLARAEAQGHATTADPDLSLVLGRRVLRPVPAGRGLRFLLPPGGHAGRLRSRTHVPAEVRPDSDDARQLGVAVAELLLDRRPVALDDRRLGAGWHRPEAGWRWTDGNGGILLHGARELLLCLGPAGRYLAGGAGYFFSTCQNIG